MVQEVLHLDRFTVLDWNIQGSTRVLLMGTIPCKSLASWLAGASLWCVAILLHALLGTDNQQFFVACEPALSGYSVSACIMHHTFFGD